jgi:hypothetical protein
VTQNRTAFIPRTLNRFTSVRRSRAEKVPSIPARNRHRARNAGLRSWALRRAIRSALSSKRNQYPPLPGRKITGLISDGGRGCQSSAYIRKFKSKALGISRFQKLTWFIQIMPTAEARQYDKLKFALQGKSVIH